MKQTAFSAISCIVYCNNIVLFEFLALTFSPDGLRTPSSTRLSDTKITPSYTVKTKIKHAIPEKRQQRLLARHFTQFDLIRNGFVRRMSSFAYSAYDSMENDAVQILDHKPLTREHGLVYRVRGRHRKCLDLGHARSPTGIAATSTRAYCAGYLIPNFDWRRTFRNRRPVINV